MNLNNYATLEASQRLVSNGIVLETEAHWHPNYEREEGSFSAIKIVGWILHPYPLSKNSIPAPSMAEVWRELPESITSKGREYNKCLVGYDGLNIASYDDDGILNYDDLCENINPTDALIDLLIFTKGLDTPK
jgi:hypothetical protein